MFLNDYKPLDKSEFENQIASVSEAEFRAPQSGAKV